MQTYIYIYICMYVFKMCTLSLSDNMKKRAEMDTLTDKIGCDVIPSALRIMMHWSKWWCSIVLVVYN